MAFEVRSEHSGDFLRLARLWQRGTFHRWIFVALDDAAERDALIRQLDTLAPGGVIAVQPAQTPLDLLNGLAQAAQHQRVHVLLQSGCVWGDSWWQDANTLRDRLADAFAKCVIFWLPDEAVNAAARHAPDLWNWREAVFDFNRRAAVDLPALQTRAFDGKAAMDKAAVLQRLAELDAYFQNTASRGTADEPSPATAHLRLEAAHAHERLGQWSEAAAFAEQAVNDFSRIGNDRMMAQAKGKIADILQARGKLDEVLAIRQNDVLPVFEQLGDIRSVAVTQGKIADILQARGKLDEALAIRQNDVLPVFEQLGDIREAAVTKGKIADILQARGKLDEALAIWQKDVLPVFEQAGYGPDAKIARQRIQNIRGRLRASPASGLLQGLLASSRRRL